MNLHKTTLTALQDVVAFAIEDLNTDLSEDELIEAYEDLDKIEEAKDYIKEALETL